VFLRRDERRVRTRRGDEQAELFLRLRKLLEQRRRGLRHLKILFLFARLARVAITIRLLPPPLLKRLGIFLGRRRLSARAPRRRREIQNGFRPFPASGFVIHLNAVERRQLPLRIVELVKQLADDGGVKAFVL